VAGNAAKLRRIDHALELMGKWNGGLVRAAEKLLGHIARNSEAGIKNCEQLVDLCGRYTTLTPRERQGMADVVIGLPNKQTAHQLGTEEITVKAHRARVMKKMKADSIADLVRMAGKIRFIAGNGAS